MFKVSIREIIFYDMKIIETYSLYNKSPLYEIKKPHNTMPVFS